MATAMELILSPNKLLEIILDLGKWKVPPLRLAKKDGVDPVQI